jgi:hypothetical protein
MQSVDGRMKTSMGHDVTGRRCMKLTVWLQLMLCHGRIQQAVNIAYMLLKQFVSLEFVFSPFLSCLLLSMDFEFA